MYTPPFTELASAIATIEQITTHCLGYDDPNYGRLPTVGGEGFYRNISASQRPSRDFSNCPRPSISDLLLCDVDQSGIITTGN